MVEVKERSARTSAVDLSVDVGRMPLKNPVMPASGTFSEALDQVFDLGRLGALVAKTIMPDLRSGNPTPRVAETPQGMLNSIGIPCKGPEHFIREIIPAFKPFDAPFVASISAGTAKGFAELTGRVIDAGADAVELNISCPNLEADGKAFAMSPAGTGAVVAEARKVTDRPLWAKLSPNAGDVATIARAAEEAGADAVVVANTILGLAIDPATRKARLGAGMGGLSGPAVRPILVRMTYQCAQALKIPVIGCGGIATADDALEYLLAGASAVQVGTATFINPTAMLTMIDALESYCTLQGFARLRDVIGAVEPWDMPHLEGFEEVAAE